MKLVRGISELTDKHSPSVVSIGNYDGVHLGHQHVISTLLLEASRLQASSTVVTFEPLAKEFFQPDSVVRLTTIEERAQLLFELGVDCVLCINFTADFAEYTPHQFIQEVLLEGLGTKFLCVGDDFKFGNGRSGDFQLLTKAGARHGFSVVAHDTFEIDGLRVSSGRVRDALTNGDFELAERLLGRPYTVSGVVSLGQQLGRTLGYPTANIGLPDTRLPVSGVYAVTVRLDERVLNGVANVGRRPTVDGNENRLEVHLFEFNSDIYGKNMIVEFVAKIRKEQKFESIDALKAQIQKDAISANALLSTK